jgi:hypothetical protein
MRDADYQLPEGPIVLVSVQDTPRPSITSAGWDPSPALRSTLLLLLLLLIQTFLLSGCAFGNRFPYSDTVARIDASGTIPVAVTAHDQRKLVTSGRENPTFVGEMRSLYHIPYGVNTASGKPLADDLTAVLATSFSAKGFEVIPVVVSHSESPAGVVKRITIMRVDRGIVLTVAEWRTDTYFIQG